MTAQGVRSYQAAPVHWIPFVKHTGATPNEVRHLSASYEHGIELARTLGFRTACVEQ
ncbi:MAG: hypothetical protein WB873_08030 [Thermoplasmata archaeon]